MEIGQERLRGGLVSSSGRVRALGLLGVAWFLVWEVWGLGLLGFRVYFLVWEVWGFGFRGLVSSSGGVWGLGF